MFDVFGGQRQNTGLNQCTQQDNVQRHGVAGLACKIRSVKGNESMRFVFDEALEFLYVGIGTDTDTHSKGW